LLTSNAGSERLLKQGLAAAHAVVLTGSVADRDEAEYFLDWALSSGLALEDQMEAWLWLSRIAQTPDRKRECLENVLAIRPAHPDARREMAVLEGRLKPEDVRSDPWASGQGVSTISAGGAVEAKRFPCPKCGASVRFDVGIDVLTCQFCGARIDESGGLAGDAPRIGVEGQDVTEQDWVSAIYTSTGHDWHLPESRVLSCEGCGATVTFAPVRISAPCLYCGSPYVVKAAPPESSLREPDGVVPFAFDAPAAREHARAWLRSQSGRGGVPDDLHDLATMHDIQPIYLPFWTFSMGGEVRWSGYIRDDMGMGASLDNADTAMQVGGLALGMLTGHYDMAVNSFMNMTQSNSEGQGLTFQEGAVPVHLEGVTVPATTSGGADLLGDLKYDTKSALAYREELLLNSPAEVYTISMADASLRARDAVVAETDREITIYTGEMFGNEVASVRKDRRGITVVSYKLLLLPAWTAGYAYRGAEYRLVVNGQSGETRGHLPRRDGAIKRLFARPEGAK
jgi:hypothetical protein